MDLYGLVGKPVKGSLSPLIQNAVLKELGGVYFAFEVDKEDLKAAIDGLRVLSKGFNVTIPYKEYIMNFLDEINEDAERIGAVNTVKVAGKRLVGYNTDYMAIKSLLNGLSVKSTAIVGAGGAARAAAYALFKLGSSRFYVFNRNRERLFAFIKYIKDLGAAAEELRPGTIADVFINATPMGMYADDSQLIELFISGRFNKALDLAYAPSGTALSRIAKGTIDGLSVLIEQAALSIKIWTGIEVDRKEMKEALTDAFG